MSEDLLRYDKIVEDALRSVVRTALDQVADHGLPGKHSLYITFRTDHPGVSIPDALAQEYPEEMTIVLEHQFWDMETHDDRFEVTLSFNQLQHRVVVPYPAITAFADPSVQFGLKFEASEIVADSDIPALTEAVAQEDTPKEEKAEESDKADDSEKVVALDSFRKK